MTSLRLDADVRDMLELARAEGCKIQYLCNAALRIHLPKLGFNVKKAK